MSLLSDHRRTASGSFRRHPIAAAVSSVLLGATASVAAQVLPVGPQVISGSAHVGTTGDKMMVTNTPNAILNWQAFSIGAQNAVRFQQQNSASQVLNRVVGNDLSSILGTLSSNGRVWLVNPNGVVFGQGARVDVAGLVASTLAITDEAFLSGKYAFQSTGGTAGVVNKGSITTSLGGRVWLVGDTVANEGAIRAEGGSIVLAAGRSIELVDSSAPNVRVKLTAPEDAVLNLGSLLAPGGSVDLHGGMVNQQGIVRADSLGAAGAGRITLSAQGDITLARTSETSASGGAGSGGTVTLDAAEGMTAVSGKLLASSSGGSGGMVAVLGERVKLADGAQVDASGARGGGQVLVGGDYRGQNTAVHNANQTLVAPGALVSANATVEGDGGRVIVWGNQTAQVYGSIAAHGAGQGGSGGFLETSGAYLDVRPASIDLSAGAGGRGGSWLLDPTNITITQGAGPDQPPSGTGTTVALSNSTIANGEIEQQLNNGVNVTVATSAAGTQAGDITVAASITKSAGAESTLTLNAHRNIVLNPAVKISGNSAGPLDVALLAGGSVQMQAGSSIVVPAGSVSIQGGLNAEPLPAIGVSISGALIDTSARTVACPPQLCPPAGSIAISGNGVTDGVRIAANSELNGGAITILAEPGINAAGLIGSTASGSAITIRTSRFVNSGLQLVNPNGRWLIESVSPGLNRGDVDLNFAFAQFSVDPANVIPALNGVGQNGLLYFTPLVLTLPVNASRQYDGTTAASFTALARPLVFGPFAVRTVDSTSVVQAQFGDKNVGTDKPLGAVPAGAAAKFSPEAGGRPVFGAQFLYTADITPKPIGVIAADKVYDQTTAAVVGIDPLQGAVPNDDLRLTVGSANFASKDAGIRAVSTQGLSLAGADSGNYVLSPSPLSATITPRPVTDLQVSGSVQKVYDATTVATLQPGQYAVTGVLAGDVVTITGPTQGSYDNPDAGTQKSVTVGGPFRLGGADAGNYQIPSALSTRGALGSRGTITPATLTFVADPALRFQGGSLAGLDGQVIGFVGSDTLGSQTSGSLQWTTPATPQSAPGRFAIFGSGLDSNNYVFVQAASNSTALTLSPANTPSAAPRAVTELVPQTLGVAFQTALATLSVPTGGSALDLSVGAGKDLFGPQKIEGRSEDELLRLLESRRQFKRKLFADAIYRLELDPSLAEVPVCATAAEGTGGQCRYAPDQLTELQKRNDTAPTPVPAATRKAALPQINRKVAVFFGVSEYQDKKIPSLETSLPDVDSVSKVVADRMGYEVRVVRNPTKADIVSTLNQLAGELGPEDSLLIYYSGHGYTLERNGAGYWLAADAPVDDPKRWISNADVSKMLAAVRSKQVALVTDSCYSSAFTREGTAGLGQGASAEDVLTKRSVVVLASGGDEPVSDESKDGHSIFAWNLMNTLKLVENWRPGTNVFTEVQSGVRRELPQTPRYGTVSSAGHQPGGDYLFEQR